MKTLAAFSLNETAFNLASLRMYACYALRCEGVILLDHVADGQRTSFRFNSAALKRAEGETRVPPFGKGW